MRLTLGDIKNSPVPEAVNLNPCDPRFTQLVNDACARLAQDGKWWGSYARMRVCAPRGCMTWPREVMTIEGINLCGWSIPIRNAWFEFQTNIRAPGIGCSERCNQSQLLERGIPPACQYRDFVYDSKIRLYPDASDVDKRVLLQGNDPNGVPIRTLDSVSGKVVYGEYVTLSLPFVESTSIFKGPHLTGVQKALTDYNVTATAVDQATNVETEIAVWQPSELNPSYRRTYIANRPNCNNLYWSGCRDNGDGCTPRDTSCTDLMAEVLYRVEFIPAVVDSDWLYIGRMDAIEYKMRSLQQERRNEDVGAEINKKRAISALRDELEAYSPMQNMVVTALPEGTASFNRVANWWTSL